MAVPVSDTACFGECEIKKYTYGETTDITVDVGGAGGMVERNMPTRSLIRVAKALVDAYKHGITVEVILDRSNRTAHYSAATFLADAGIPTSIDAAHEIAHNKVMIIDGSAQTNSAAIARTRHDGDAHFSWLALFQLSAKFAAGTTMVLQDPASSPRTGRFEQAASLLFVQRTTAAGDVRRILIAH